MTKHSTSAVTPGHQKLDCTLLSVFSTPVWPATQELCAALRIFVRMDSGARMTFLVLCLFLLSV